MSLKTLSYKSVYLMSRTVRCFTGYKQASRNMALKSPPALADFGKTLTWQNQATRDGTGHSRTITLGGINRHLYNLHMGNFESKSKEQQLYESQLSEDFKNSLLPLSDKIKKSIAFGKTTKRNEEKGYEYRKNINDYKEFEYKTDYKQKKNYKDNDGRDWEGIKKVPFKTNEVKKPSSLPARTRKQEILFMMKATTPKKESQEGNEAKLYSNSFKESNRKLLGLAKRDNSKENARLDEIHSLELNMTPQYNDYWKKNTNMPDRKSMPRFEKITDKKQENKKRMDAYFGEFDKDTQWSSGAPKQFISSSASSAYFLKGTNMEDLKAQFTKNAEMRRHLRKSLQ